MSHASRRRISKRNKRSQESRVCRSACCAGTYVRAVFEYSMNFQKTIRPAAPATSVFNRGGDSQLMSAVRGSLGFLPLGPHLRRLSHPGGVVDVMTTYRRESRCEDSDGCEDSAQSPGRLRYRQPGSVPHSRKRGTAHVRTRFNSVPVRQRRRQF